MVAHISSGFDSWVVLNSLVKEITELKVIKPAIGLIPLPFRCGVKIVNTVEVPQYVKFTCSKSQVKDLEKKSVENTDSSQNSSKEKMSTRFLIKVFLLN